MTSPSAEGWQPDPDDRSGRWLMYWDGESWTGARKIATSSERGTADKWPAVRELGYQRWPGRRESRKSGWVFVISAVWVVAGTVSLIQGHTVSGLICVLGIGLPIGVLTAWRVRRGVLDHPFRANADST